MGEVYSLATRNHGSIRITHLWVLPFFASLLQPVTAQSYNFNIGGGPGFPVNQTGNFANTSYNFVVGGGPNLRPHIKFVAEFMFQGLPVRRDVMRELREFSVKSRLYSFTGDFIAGTVVDGKNVYLIGGGGWYRRSIEMQKRFHHAGTACPAVVVWWNVQCVNGVFPTTGTIGSQSLDAGGVNIGGGVAFGIRDSRANLYAEIRYHHAFTNGVATDVFPLTVGVRW